MTSKAHVTNEWHRNGIGIAVLRDEGSTRELLQWAPVAVKRYDVAEATGVEAAEEDRLHLLEDDARAIYEALADHFGHAGHDIRALRKDYDAERKRVDSLIANLIGK